MNASGPHIRGDLLFIFKHGQRELEHTQEDEGHRFRCNSFADALCGAAIARHLMRTARGGRL